MSAPISPLAAAYLRKKASEQMMYECTITRPGKPTIGVDLKATPPTPTTIYTGKCRVWSEDTGNSILVGDTEIHLQTTNISIPWNATPIPTREDEIVITVSPGEPMYLNKVFQIQVVTKGGDLRPTRRFQVTMMQERLS